MSVNELQRLHVPETCHGYAVTLSDDARMFRIIC